MTTTTTTTGTTASAPGPAPTRRQAPRLVVGVLALGVAFGGLAACAGGGSNSSSTSAGSAQSAVGAADRGVSGAEGPAAANPEGDAAKSSGQSSSGRDGAAAAGPVALQQRRQVRSGELVVVVKDVDTAAASVRATVTAAQGYVQNEETSTRPTRHGGDGPADLPAVEVDRSVLTLRVPQQSLDRVMEQVSAVGSVRSRSQASTDVTDQFVDTASRVKSQKASVERVRTLLGRATSIGDVVRLESELSNREADLESLEARLAALSDSTTFATLAVTLARPDATITPATPRHGGFVGGLLDGWHALGASASVVLQIVGALIPFAVLLALVGLPVWLVLRRRRTAAGSA